MRGLRRKEYVYAVRGPGLSESTSRDTFVNVQPVSFEVLGPLAVTRGGVPSDVRGGRRRALLLRLLVSANQFVDGDRLADDIWEGQPPAGAASTLASHVSLLRKVIGAERLESRAGAYRLILRDGELDAESFLDDLDDGQGRFAAVTRQVLSRHWTPRWRVGAAPRGPTRRARHGRRVRSRASRPRTSPRSRRASSASSRSGITVT